MLPTFKALTPGVDFINFLRPICVLRPTFEKLFRGVGRTLRRAPNFDRAISMICALRPTFMKLTPGIRCFKLVCNGVGNSTLPNNFFTGEILGHTILAA